MRLRQKIMILGTALTGLGCSAAPEEANEDWLGKATAALPAASWNAWNVVGAQNGSLAAPETPTACGTPYGDASGTALFARNSTNRYTVSIMSRSPYTNWTNTWGGGNLTFSSRPTCVSLDYDEQNWPTNNQVIVFGRSGAQNRYYASVLKLGTLNQFGVPPTLPTVFRGWTQVNTEAFASAPAVTHYDGSLYLIGRKSNNSVVFQQGVLNMGNPSDPYGAVSWGTPFTLPALPAGWTAAGDPTIAAGPYGEAYPTVAIRGTSMGTWGIFYTTRDMNTQQWVNWRRISTGNTIVASDPSMEVSVDKTLRTVYFRASDSRIYQSTSVVGTTTWETFTAIRTDTFVNAPSAAGGNLGTDPYHMVYARKTGSNDIWVAGTGNGIP